MDKRFSRVALGLAAVFVFAGSVVAAFGQPGSQITSGVGAIPTAIPTPIPAPSNSIVPLQSYMLVGADKTVSAQQPHDPWWMTASRWDNDDRPSAASATTWWGNSGNSSMYAPFMSLRMYDEACPANEGGVCRQPMYDQREQDFLHQGDPLTGLPSVGGSGSGVSCIWNWPADGRSEVGGYKLYDAAHDTTPIATIATGTTTYTEAGLTIGTTYFRYVDSILINTTLGSAVTTANAAASVTLASGTNVMAHTRLHIAGANPEDVEVYPSPIPAAGTLTAYFTKTHAATDPVTLEAAYSGLDPLDTTQTAMNNTTQPSYGTRLPANAIGNAIGETIASCMPLASSPSAAVLANPIFIQQPTPYPQPPNTPMPHLTMVTFTGSVQEVASSQATPSLFFVDNSDGSNNTLQSPSPQMWSKAACGTGCMTWTITSVPTEPYKGDPAGKFGPIDEQYCVGTVCTRWDNYAKNDRAANPAYTQLDAFTLTPCTYEHALDQEDTMDDLIVQVLANPSPGHSLEIASEEIAKEETSKNFDISAGTNPYLMSGHQLAACSQINQGAIEVGYAAGSTHDGSFSAAAALGTGGVGGAPAWNIGGIPLSWNDGYFVNFGSAPAGTDLFCNPPLSNSNGSDCNWNNSPALTHRAFDSAWVDADGASYPSKEEYEGIATTVLEDANHAPNPIIDELGNDPRASGAGFTFIYYAMANDLLFRQFPNGISSPPSTIEKDTSYDHTNFWFPLVPDKFAPIGYPLEPLIPFTLPVAGSSPAPLWSTALWNPTESLFERWYSNGVVFVCPTTGNTVNCSGHSHTFTQTAYRLNVDSGLYFGMSPAARNYTAGTTTGGIATNSAQIWLYDPL